MENTKNCCKNYLKILQLKSGKKCAHAKEFEEQYWIVNHIIDEEVDKIIFLLGEDSNSSTSEDSHEEQIEKLKLILHRWLFYIRLVF